ncbi:muts domain V-domain-containing protein [Neohortaea acidophila]|uniref:Muts domain V-domain-containing protein n=1 Tax=Neohortaea acidophila TaxID=245834 RepID=A0A6A6PKW4_9PEZI|nr:muts domain V-domain-containing protein [Neohortaea acidophila]KAF2480700.1 muts domain V-domain-containing protein [Neohortaea acidophila]
MTATGSEASATTTNRLSAPHPLSVHSGTFQTGDYITTASRPRTSRRSTARPSTARPRTGISTLGVPDQEIVCAVSESRGISPTVGLAFVNLDTGEAVLSQISDSQTYVRTVHKLLVYNPSTALIVGTAANPKSKLFSIIEESVEPLGTTIELLDRRYWAETTGLEYIQQLAFAEDVETVKTAVGGNYYAVCCFAAVLKYVELSMGKTFPFRSLRIKYEPSEGSMMIDLSTIHSLELVQNLHNTKSKECLFGLLNQTLTPMGARLLRANILQPLTNPDTLNTRYEAVEELSTKEEMFFAARAALKPFLDVDKMLTQLILIPTQPTLKDTEQAVNNVMMLKQFVSLIPSVFEALTGSRCSMLHEIRGLCNPDHIDPIRKLINDVINEDVTFAKKPVELRNQRSYAVRSGVNGLLDVARQTYHESMNDAYQHVTELKEEHNLDLNLKFEATRQFFLRLSASELEERNLPAVFINAYRKKDIIECQTLRLMKQNQKIADAHTEVLLMSDKSVQDVIVRVREHMSILFKICEGIAVLDMLASFAQVVTSRDYARPQIGDALAIRAARHPIRESIHKAEFVPNDVYATQQTRFQVITGCNMSGKSTYIRSVALMTVMAHIGSFVPAEFAVFPITRQLFARISLDDNVEANVSTFAAEMRETAFILRNIDRQSMAIIDELGRGTSTRDGLAIALAIAEALVQSRALVWFVTHFTDLAQIMLQRNGVVNYHLAVDMSEQNKMEMQYRLSSGTEQQEHYGLKLARVVPLPPDVLEHAEEVSRTLEQQAKRKKRRSLGVIRNRRRVLLLNLKEQLVQARNGKMEGEQLREWLKRLQGDFVLQMTALEEEERKAEWSGEENGDGPSVQQRDQDFDSVSGFVRDAHGESEMLLGDDGEAWMAGGNDAVEQAVLRQG